MALCSENIWGHLDSLVKPQRLLVSNVLLSCGDAPDPEIAQRMVQAETDSLLRAI
jgi:hypothetical protein